MSLTTRLLPELACSLMWPLSMWVYGLVHVPPAAAWVLGALSYLTLVALGAFLNEDPKKRPHLTAGHVGALYGLGRIDVERALVILLVQALGPTIGMGMLERHNVTFHAYWNGLRHLRPTFWGMFTAQTVCGALCATLLIQLSDMPADKHPKKGPFWDMSRSGIWLMALCYPWAGPSISMLSWRWIDILFEQDAQIVCAFAVCSFVLQSLVAMLLTRIIEFRSETAPIDDDNDAPAPPPPLLNGDDEEIE